MKLAHIHELNACVFIILVWGKTEAPGVCERKRETRSVNIVNCVSGVKVGQVWESGEQQSLGKERYLGKLYLAVRGWRERKSQTKKVFCTWRLTIWWAPNLRETLLAFRETWEVQASMKRWKTQSCLGFRDLNYEASEFNIAMGICGTCWYSFFFFLKSHFLAQNRESR